MPVVSSMINSASAYTNSIDSSEESTCPHHDQHEDLKKISIVDYDTLREIIPNSAPVKIDNECFSGEVMLLIRTPDVDNGNEPVPTGDTPQRISKYFKGYKRRFEFQFQIKFKKRPTGPLFLGCEVDDTVKLSTWSRGLTGFLLAMIRRINSGFHYSWGVDSEYLNTQDLEDKNYEKTHLSFPVEASMDRIVVTKPGEEPPQLGFALEETPESVKRRRRMGFGSVDWNTEDTYTMCLWNAYMDWISWKSMNVPGCRPFPLSNVTGHQPVYLCVYELADYTPQEYKKKRPPHTQRNLKHWSRLEFAHIEATRGGVAPRFQGKALYDESGETDSELCSEHSDD